MAEANRLWSAARRMQKEGLRGPRPRSQRTSHRQADGGADEAEGERGQGTERDATIDGQRQQGLDVRQSQGPCESLGQASALPKTLGEEGRGG